MKSIDPGVTGRSGEADFLVPARKVLQRYDVSDRTISRWLENPKLGFPKPVRVNSRRYWKLSELEAWERAVATARAEKEEEPP